MQWELTDEQQMFSDALREWVAGRFPVDDIRTALDTGDSAAFTSGLIGDGWWGVGHPEADGGQGGGFLETALAAVEFGRAAAPNSAWLAAEIAAPVVADRASLLAGRTRTVLAVPADRAPVVTDVRMSGNRLTGTVRHVLGAPGADILLVPVATPDGVRLAEVSAADAVVTAEPLLDRSREAATVAFDGALARLTDVDAEAALREAASRGAVLVAADALGSGQRMLDLAVEYSRQRRQFGRFIGEFQAVKHACAQMLVTVEAAYSITLYAAAALEAGAEDAAILAAVAKAQVTAHVADLADSALTVHGAIGYTWEHELQLHYKRAKLDRSLFGSPTVWNEQVATAVLAAARDRADRRAQVPAHT